MTVCTCTLSFTLMFGIIILLRIVDLVAQSLSGYMTSICLIVVVPFLGYQDTCIMFYVEWSVVSLENSHSKFYIRAIEPYQLEDH